MTLALARQRSDGLAAYGLFAACLAMAGLPVYIHAPKVFADSHGVSLAALGATLFALRLLDVGQDPVLARLAEVTRHRRGQGVGLALAAMAAGMIGLFAVDPPLSPLWWFAICLALVFSGYSFLSIVFYAQGVSRAGSLGHGGHIRLARWRETGALIGVSLAAVAPMALMPVTDRPYAACALGFAGLCAVAGLAMQREWSTADVPPGPGFAPILKDRIARRLLLVALLNAAPVAVTATLFLYFVGDRLAAPEAGGPLLLAFFVAAALAAPLWGRLAEHFGAKRVLLAGMALSVTAFALALGLGPGQVRAFAVICAVSGAALGADLTLLPALFAARMARISPSAAEGFGLWSFVGKFALALAALVLLPVLDAAGFAPGAENSGRALAILGLLYAGLPCVLKLAAIALLAATSLED
ncbi:MAG: MFS transporter [Marinibacterium sp.]